MKNLLKLLFIFFSISIFSQEKRNGISYQALIINPSGEELPGYNNQNSPLVNTSICLEFIINDENGAIEYSEYQTVTTDQYGMVNIIIGSGGVFAGGYAGNWNGIVWSEKSKSLTVNLDTTAACSDFSEISKQELTSVPFALFAPGQEGRDGEDGKSAYQIWLDAGNSGSEQDFIDSLKGDKGDDGNDGADGSSGQTGSAGLNSLILTSIEAAGSNCVSGGIKIESGLDIDSNGTLDSGEVTQTQYICNGNDGEDGVDGQDGDDGSGSGSNCFSFDILGVVETTMDASGITHDPDYPAYPGVASGLLSSNIEGTNMVFNSLNTNKFVISSTGQERLPEYELAIVGYDSGGALLDLSIKLEQYWWMGNSGSGYDPKRKGGGFPLLGAISEPRTTTFYYKGNRFDSNIGGKIYNRGGVEGPNEYGMNLEILSNKTIDRIILTYTPVNWTTAGAGYTRSKIINSFINYNCSTSSSNSGGEDGSSSSSNISPSGSAVPYDVVIIEKGQSYTIPSGFVGEISGYVMEYNPFIAESNGSFINSENNYGFVIDGEEYLFGEWFQQGGIQTQTGSSFNYNMIKGSVWVETNSSISINSSKNRNIDKLVVKIHRQNLFTVKLITEPAVVPPGKIWELSTVLIKEHATLQGYERWRYKNYYVNINDRDHIFLEVGHQTSNTESQKVSTIENEMWFPAGTKLAPTSSVKAYSIIEFDANSL